jgi:hypothetical protein
MNDEKSPDEYASKISGAYLWKMKHSYISKSSRAFNLAA